VETTLCGRNRTLRLEINLVRVDITLVSVENTFVRVEITLRVGITLERVEITLVSVILLSYLYKSHSAGANCTLIVEITLVRVGSILVRFEITICV
jgi:hypothetical protein